MISIGVLLYCVGEMLPCNLSAYVRIYEENNPGQKVLGYVLCLINRGKFRKKFKKKTCLPRSWLDKKLEERLHTE